MHFISQSQTRMVAGRRHWFAFAGRDLVRLVVDLVIPVKKSLFKNGRINAPVYLFLPMEFFVNFSQVLIGDMGIDLSRTDMSMTQQRLYTTQVGAVAE